MLVTNDVMRATKSTLTNPLAVATAYTKFHHNMTVIPTSLRSIPPRNWTRGLAN